MVNMVMFTTTEDLMKLTGLDRYGLWDAGFDLDDWDCGFCTDTKLHAEYERREDESEEEYLKHKSELVADWHNEGYWLLSRMEYYCVGGRVTEYNGKYYYITYHS